MSKPSYLSSQIFLDSGDPDETRSAITTLGFLDGQTTNPSLVAKNPHIQKLKQEGRLNAQKLWESYREVALEIHSLIPNGAISVEVYADKDTGYEEMLEQAIKLKDWFPGVFVKLPVTPTGLQVARTLVAEGVNVNITLCFSQEQAAAVHTATKGAKKGQIFVSPFIGRLDDIGLNGLDLIANITRMYSEWGSHVLVLGASIRNLEHFFGSLERKVDILTCPIKVLEEWGAYGLENEPSSFNFSISNLKPIAYENIEEKILEEYNLEHELTNKGLEKFSIDWKSLISN